MKLINKCVAVAAVGVMTSTTLAATAASVQAVVPPAPGVTVSFGTTGLAPVVPGTQPLSAFTSLFAPEEAAAPGNLNQQITKCRKLFYNSRGWDSFLIPGAAGVPGPTVKNPEGIKTVRTPAGDVVDISHVCAGLDAANHPSAAGVAGVASIDSNLAATTWAGDLGSVLAANYLWSRNHGNAEVPASVKQQNVSQFAGPADLLGDADAYAIADVYSTGVTANSNLGADVLNTFYAGPARRLAPAARHWTSFYNWAHDYRLEFFSSQLGLSRSGNVYGNAATWIDSHAADVHAAAAMYLLDSGQVSAGLAYLSSNADDARSLLRAFVDGLNIEAQALTSAINWA